MNISPKYRPPLIKKWCHGRIGLNTVIYSIGSGKLEGGTSFRSWIQRWKGGREKEIIIITDIINMTRFMYMERQIRSHSIFF